MRPTRSPAERAASSTSAVELTDLASHRFATVRRSVASNRATPDDVVAALAEAPDELTRLHAATAAVHRPTLHDLLSRSQDKWVRAVLADVFAATPGRALSYAVQARLTRDEFVEVRARVARHTAYGDLFEQLLVDNDAKVRAACAANPRATREHIEALVGDRAWSVRGAAAASGVLYPDNDQLVRLARDRSAQVRWAVIFRPGAPAEAIAIIAADSDEMNRHHASRLLAGEDLVGAQPRAVARHERRRAAQLAFESPPE